ncbi:MAG: hypothetical protein ACRC0H_09775, partial [Aeromonas sobria]
MTHQKRTGIAKIGRIFLFTFSFQSLFLLSLFTLSFHFLPHSPPHYPSHFYPFGAVLAGKRRADGLGALLAQLYLFGEI